ncbi:MAG: phage terminase large subunit family protein [Gemmatimonadaceae bacterium]|nr:phage terminase large subunit family protein [Gemmatimonadaceae bacterium]
MLSAEGSAQPGPWQTARAPYLREIMDVVSGREHQDVTVVKCSQSGGTEVINNAVGYYIDQEPSPLLVIQPNVKPMAEAWSKDRLAPMLRDTPRLQSKVKDPRSRDSGNTVLHKVFPGGYITVVGANSPAGLASRPIRVVLADELDRWTSSAGTEGDPLKLADARQITFRHRKKKVKVSSPGNEGESRIEKEWKASDQRHYYVPCPHCGHEQPLEWRDTAGRPDIRPGTGPWRLVWEKLEGANEDETVHRPETAKYQCRACEALIDETHKPAMLASGRWVKHNPTSTRAGFHVSGLLSPWLRWKDLAQDWLDSKDDDEQRKTFFNTKLGLLYVLDGDAADPTKLSSRCAPFAAEVPMGVGLLTLAVDVQGDRLEVLVIGWGAKEECWVIRLQRFDGDPETDEPWSHVQALLDRVYLHESGAEMRIDAAMIDSGFKKDPVYRFVRPREARRVYAYKGKEGATHPIARAQKPNKDGVRLWTVDPNVYKDLLFGRLRRSAPGAGYLHFGKPEETGVDEAFFKQFGAEKRLVEWKGLAKVVRYVNPSKLRNEAIDLYVMNLAALRSLGPLVTKELATRQANIQLAGAKKRAAESETPSEAPPVPKARPRPRHGGGGWATGGGRWGKW